MEAKALLVGLGALFALAVIVSHPGVFTLFLAGAIAAGVVFKVVLPRRTRESLHQKADALVANHADQLVRRKAQLIRQDAYGKLLSEPWEKEVEHFITQHIGPSLTAGEQRMLARERGVIARRINEHVDIVSRDRPAFQTFTDNMTPTGFETFCAGQLRQSGWDARVTARSRDQGVDVVAVKDGIRLVLQCKLYSAPVGNKAVQEIAAGRTHEQAHYGAVVTNSRYTAAAEQLAATNGILLLHYSDLAQVESLLQSRPTR